MKALVTGAAGLLGSHLVDLLVARDDQVRALVGPADQLGDRDEVVDVHVGDIRDRAVLEAAVDDVDYVFHCAARTGPWGPEREYETTNVGAVETLVRVASAAGVRRIVHVSSITVHGNDVRGAADEDAPLRGEPNPYSRSKVAGERLLARLIAEDAAPVTIVRPGWVYGPRDVASFARFTTMIHDGRMVMVGPGTNHVPLIYVTDVAHGMILAAETANAAGRTYVLVNDESVTQREYLGAIAREMDVAPPTRRIPYRLGVALGAALEAAARGARRTQPPPLMRYGIQMLGGENRFTIARARRELGFSPQVDLAEGVRRSIEWYRSAYAEMSPTRSR